MINVKFWIDTNFVIKLIICSKINALFSLKFCENIIIDMFQVGRIDWLRQLLIDAALQRSQVLRLEKFQLICNLMHLALLLKRKRLLHPWQWHSFHVHSQLLWNDFFTLCVKLFLSFLDACLWMREPIGNDIEEN